MRYFHPFLQFLLVLAFLLSSCRSKWVDYQENEPVLQKAWNARHSYDISNRRIASFSNGKQIGRSWGRDELGRMNYDQFFLPNTSQSEDLLYLYHARLDSGRDAKWQDAEKKLMDKRLAYFEGNFSEEMESDVSEEGSKDAEVVDNIDFIPDSFIPGAIEPSESTPESPFLPIEETGGKNPSSPAVSEELPPSPFAPLPPL